MTGVLSFIGWLGLCFFLPTGMWAICFDFIGAWVLRPRIMETAEFNREKAGLANKVAMLLAQGKELVQEKEKVGNEKWSCAKWSKSRAL